MMWKGPNGKDGPCVYLTFDDGPVPEITPWVLDILKKNYVKATFFCLGRNVKAYPDIFQRIIDEGHSVGNHTYSHVSGYKGSLDSYLSEVEKAAAYIGSDLFRPPYGRIKISQVKAISPKYRIVMWDVLSGDFDPQISAEKCKNNVLKNVSDGSIVVFHDNAKAYPNLKKSLAGILEALTGSGYQFLPIKIQR